MFSLLSCLGRMEYPQRLRLPAGGRHRLKPAAFTAFHHLIDNIQHMIRHLLARAAGPSLPYGPGHLRRAEPPAILPIGKSIFYLSPLDRKSTRLNSSHS